MEKLPQRGKHLGARFGSAAPLKADQYLPQEPKLTATSNSIDMAPPMTWPTKRLIEAPATKWKHGCPANVSTNKRAKKSRIVGHFHPNSPQKSFSGYYFFSAFSPWIKEIFSIKLNKSLKTKSRQFHSIFFIIFSFSLEVFLSLNHSSFLRHFHQRFGGFFLILKARFFFYHKKAFFTTYNYTYIYTYNYTYSHTYSGSYRYAHTCRSLRTKEKAIVMT